MDGAAVRAQELAQGMARHPQAHAVARAVDVLAFKCRRGHPQKPGGPREVGFGQVYEALLAATFRSSGLALETQTFGAIAALADLLKLRLEHGDVLFFLGGQFFAQISFEPCRQLPRQLLEMVARAAFHFERDLV